MLTKKEQRLRRARQTRIRIAQQGAVRLTVNRTNLHIYANVISDDGAKVLASASTAEAEVRARSVALARVATPLLRNWSASASLKRPRPLASRRWRLTVPVLPTTAG
ncbi:50S ribosomal protein L18 [Hydrogenophaga sp. T4]|nr:50S ribosomal protein L18 [Hydrogenophaga sp. T4]